MTKQEILGQFFLKNFPFNKEGLEQLILSFEIELFKKNQILLNANSIDLKLKFIESGFVREFYVTNSKEINIDFYGPNEFSTDLTSFFEGTKTLKCQQCLSNVKVFSLTKRKLDIILKKYHCGHEIVRTSFQKAFAAKEAFERKKITKSADELYKDLQINKPEWLQNIPQYHIASYLNVSPETLSRIRKRIS